MQGETKILTGEKRALGTQVVEMNMKMILPMIGREEGIGGEVEVVQGEDVLEAEVVQTEVALEEEDGTQTVEALEEEEEGIQTEVAIEVEVGQTEEALEEEERIQTEEALEGEVVLIGVVLDGEVIQTLVVLEVGAVEGGIKVIAGTTETILVRTISPSIGRKGRTIMGKGGKVMMVVMSVRIPHH